ncbi:MAG: hypothetical protein M1454_03165 [Candidatus Thermoplasmatota archaeon]|nr:hypothetical protein [Candidatus Thermoplasmatota archaeon]MCL5731667.1 hypothetical protein [Candidatus Thermoplasmatota archaeon]
MAENKENDRFESLLMGIMDNADVIESLLPLMKRLRQAGIFDLFSSVARDYVPTDIEFLGHFFSSREFTYAALKSANLLLSFMYAFSDEKVSDMLKNIMFNLRGVVDQAESVSTTQGKQIPLEVYRLLRDPDTRAGILASLGAMKAIGEIIRKGEKV